MDFFNFRNAGGTTTLSYIQGSDGAFVGNTLLAHDFLGTAIESFDATLSESGGTVTLSLEQSGGGDLQLRFSDGLYTFDCTPAATVPLTPGTDASPTGNYVYILQSDKTLTVDTDWPSAEHVKIAYILCPSATFVNNNGAYINQNWNDHQFGSQNMGHIAHIGEKIRLGWGGGQYFSGVNGAGTSDYITINGGSSVDFKSSSGVIYQMHKHTFPAVDTSTGDTLLVKNWSGDAYHDITDLFEIVADSNGTTFNNNKWFNLVVWGVANKTGTYEPIIINLPSGDYNTQAGAEGDTSNYDDYSIPREFGLDSSTAFLICRITVQKQATTWAYGSTLDLRGQVGTVVSGIGGLPAHDHYNTSTDRATVLYTEGLSVGNVHPLEIPVGYAPAVFNFVDTADDRSIDAGRFISENQSTNVNGLSRALYLKTTPYSEFDGTIIGMERDTTNGTAGKTMPPAIVLTESYAATDVDEAVGVYMNLTSAVTGATAPETIVGFKANVQNANTNNDAFLAENGNIWVQSNNEGIYFGNDRDAFIYYDNTNLVIDPKNFGSGRVDLQGELSLPASNRIILGSATIQYNGTDLSITPGTGKLSLVKAGYGFEQLDGTGTIFQSYLDGAGVWLGSASAHSLHLYVNSGGTAALELDTSNDARFLGSIHLLDNEKINFGNSNDSTLYFNGSTDTLMTLNSAHRFNVAGKLYVASGNRQDSASLDFNQTSVTGNSTVEAASELRAMNVLAQTGNGANKGRNFAKYYGSRVEAKHNRISDITYASREGVFTGGDFRATYANTGRITGNASGSSWIGGEFIAGISGTKSGAVVPILLAKGGSFAVTATGGNYLIADAIAGHFQSNLSVAATRNYGILVENIATGGTADWGINVDGSDVQISSDNYLLLEGSSTSKGDTGLRWNSSSSRMEFDVNGTTEMELNADGLRIPVKTTTGDPTGFDGLMYLNTSDNLLRIYNGSWKTVADVS
jgi:hypothetical protein